MSTRRTGCDFDFLASRADAGAADSWKDVKLCNKPRSLFALPNVCQLRWNAAAAHGMIISCRYHFRFIGPVAVACRSAPFRGISRRLSGCLTGPVAGKWLDQAVSSTICGQCRGFLSVCCQETGASSTVACSGGLRAAAHAPGWSCGRCIVAGVSADLGRLGLPDLKIFLDVVDEACHSSWRRVIGIPARAVAAPVRSLCRHHDGGDQPPGGGL